MIRIHDALSPGTVYFRNRGFTRSEIMDGVDQFARRLSDTVVSRSPFVYLFASNHLKTLLALFGIAKAGRICVIVDPHIGRLELDEMLIETPPAACVHIDTPTVGWNFDRELEVVSGSRGAPDREDIDDVCIMMHTCADDGYAKAAMLTHENMVSDAFAIAAGNGVVPGTVSMSALPVSHGFGLQTGLFTPAISGGDTVIVETTDVVNVEKRLTPFIDERKVTHLYSVPAVYYMLCKNLRRRPRSMHLKSLISGGYALNKRIYETMLTACGLPIRQGYGLTEAAPVCSWVFTENQTISGCIGRPISCCDMKIMKDPSEKSDSDSPGEILVKGSNVMKGYYRHHAVNSRVLEKGWLHTGDIGYQDLNGYFYFLKTKKRMINHAGLKIYPAEVERYLAKNGMVAGTVVYGIDDPVCGEKVGCLLHLKYDTPDVRHGIRCWMSTAFSRYKVPKVLQFVDERAMDEAKNRPGCLTSSCWVERYPPSPSACDQGSPATVRAQRHMDHGDG